MSFGPEYVTVEKPFLDQLAGIGWRVVTGSLDGSVGDRSRELSRGPPQGRSARRARADQPRRDGAALARRRRIIAGGERHRAHRCAARSWRPTRQATELLLEGIRRRGAARLGSGPVAHRPLHRLGATREQHLHGRQPVPRRLPGRTGSKEFIVPDIVLFVNGIPLVVVECKSPAVSEPIATAIDQLRRYSNQRRAAGEVEDNEGNERLFHTNQFLVATSFDEARVGHHQRRRPSTSWSGRTPRRSPLAEVQQELGKRTASPARRSSSPGCCGRRTCSTSSGTSRSSAGRRSDDQDRLPLPAVPRRAGCDRATAARQDRQAGRRARPARRHRLAHPGRRARASRMVFLVRKMRTIPELRRFKVVRGHRPQRPAETAVATPPRSPARPFGSRAASSM